MFQLFDIVIKVASCLKSRCIVVIDPWYIITAISTEAMITAAVDKNSRPLKILFLIASSYTITDAAYSFYQCSCFAQFQPQRTHMNIDSTCLTGKIITPDIS